MSAVSDDGLDWSEIAWGEWFDQWSVYGVPQRVRFGIASAVEYKTEAQVVMRFKYYSQVRYVEQL